MLEIASNLWLGNAMEIRDPKLLFDRDIKAVIDLAYEEKPMVPARQFLYFRFPIVDSDGNDRCTLTLAIQALLNLLRDDVATAIGCSAGMSRSPTISAFTLSIYSGTGVKEIIEQIAHERTLEINPALWNEVQSCVDQLIDRR